MRAYRYLLDHTEEILRIKARIITGGHRDSLT